MEVYKIIANKRRELGLTLDDIAKYVGVNKTTVKKWEDGFIENMRRDKIQKLSEILKISPLILLGMKPDEEAVKTFKCSISEQDLIKKYRCLSPEGKATVEAVIEVQYKAVQPDVKRGTAG